MIKLTFRNFLWTLLILFTLTGCGGSGGKIGATNPSSVPTSSSSAAASSVNSSMPNLVTQDSFTGSNSRLIGRFDHQIADRVRFTWPGSAIDFRFNGTFATIGIDDTGSNRFQIDVDGASHELYPIFGNHKYTLAADLVQGNHSIRITRLSESFVGISAFTTDPTSDGGAIIPPVPATHRMLVLGDSISAGFGVEGANTSCNYAVNTSNQQLTYAAVAANALDADLHSIAWSGIGVYRSYNEITPIAPTIRDRNKLTLADDITSLWDTTNYQPEVIVVAIGTNDYWDGNPEANYRTAMEDLLSQLHTSYADATIYLMVSPMLWGDKRTSQLNVLNALLSDKIKLFDAGVNDGSEGFGCLNHPNKVTNARIGKLLEQTIRNDLHW